MAHTIYLFITIMATLNIYSINANGLRNIDKAKNMIALVNEWNCDILLLQETFWDEDILNIMEKLWDGTIYYSITKDKNNHCGVAALVSNKLKGNISFVNKDIDGRLVSINYKTNEHDFNIISVYAPNNNLERAVFFNSLNEFVGNKPTIIGGDMNTTFSPIDRLNTIHIDDRSCDILKNVCIDNN